MDIRGMHYDVKYKLNKIDSQQYRNLKVPEIDWVLNEAYEVYIKSIAEPRQKNNLGFETSQRSIDDIRPLVKDAVEITTVTTSGVTTAPLPLDYMFYLSSDVIMTKPACGDRPGKSLLKQHDDYLLGNHLYKSSYEWGIVNIRFYSAGIRIFTDTTFTVPKLILDYIRKPAYIHNAQDFLPTGSYKLPDGTVLTGTQDCELPPHTHREIVDIAVLILTGNLQIPDYQIKQAKLNLNN
jgi:hypothetical protein